MDYNSTAPSKQSLVRDALTRRIDSQLVMTREWLNAYLMIIRAGAFRRGEGRAAGDRTDERP